MPMHLLGISRRRDIASLPCHWSGGQPAAVRRLPTEAMGGADCREVRWVVRGCLAAATVYPLPASFGPLDHARLVAAIHAEISILPVRYGAVLPGEEAVQDFLSSRGEDLSRDLGRVEGKSEIGLRIELARGPAPAEPPAPNGSCPSDLSPAGYLAVRRARYQWHDQLNTQAQSAAETCVGALKGLCRDWRRLSPEPLGTVRLAFLVERRLSEAFAARLEMLRAQRTGQRYTLVGPWPPYSFV